MSEMFYRICLLCQEANYTIKTSTGGRVCDECALLIPLNHIPKDDQIRLGIYDDKLAPISDDITRRLREVYEHESDALTAEDLLRLGRAIREAGISFEHMGGAFLVASSYLNGAIEAAMQREENQLHMEAIRQFTQMCANATDVPENLLRGIGNGS